VRVPTARTVPLPGFASLEGRGAAAACNSKRRAGTCTHAIRSQFNTEDLAMNWDRIEGNWKQFKGNVKEQWGKLTDDELDRIGGRRDQLVGRIQERYGIARDEADREIDDWLRRYDADRQRAARL
jgi:uncharacterized protein YjbJ (UPF0337 family)